jgi:hypothetical protein
MSVELVVAKSSKATGLLLTAALKDAGVQVTKPARCRVSYGVPGLGTDLPTLNRNAGDGNKYDQMVRVKEAGVRVPPLYLATDAPDKFPLLARRFQHKGGTDIKVVLQVEELPWRAASGSDFFVEYVPIDTEYRVWTYRGRHMGTYRKEQRHPELFKRVGRNFKNGFAFVAVERDGVPTEAIDIAAAAVDALRLDFGATDILRGKDGAYYFLEVNTAPGVQGTRQVIGSLARHIAKWERNPQERQR